MTCWWFRRRCSCCMCVVLCSLRGQCIQTLRLFVVLYRFTVFLSHHIQFRLQAQNSGENTDPPNHHFSGREAVDYVAVQNTLSETFHTINRHVHKNLFFFIKLFLTHNSGNKILQSPGSFHSEYKNNLYLSKQLVTKTKTIKKMLFLK